jgi:hypothetical protein
MDIEIKVHVQPRQSLDVNDCLHPTVALTEGGRAAEVGGT